MRSRQRTGKWVIKIRKAINFDIDTKEYEKFTSKKAPTAYLEIKGFLKKNGFEHRQGSGYVSKENLSDRKVTAIIIKMTQKLKWTKYCMKEIDATNVGKQHSLLNIINESRLSDLEI